MSRTMSVSKRRKLPAPPEDNGSPAVTDEEGAKLGRTMSVGIPSKQPEEKTQPNATQERHLSTLLSELQEDEFSNEDELKHTIEGLRVKLRDMDTSTPKSKEEFLALRRKKSALQELLMRETCPYCKDKTANYQEHKKLCLARTGYFEKKAEHEPPTTRDALEGLLDEFAAQAEGMDENSSEDVDTSDDSVVDSVPVESKGSVRVSMCVTPLEFDWDGNQAVDVLVPRMSRASLWEHDADRLLQAEVASMKAEVELLKRERNTARQEVQDLREMLTSRDQEILSLQSRLQAAHEAASPTAATSPAWSPRRTTMGSPASKRKTKGRTGKAKDAEEEVARTMALDLEKLILSGLLQKCDPNQKNWKKRFFIFTGEYLSYYKSAKEKVPSGTVPMGGYRASYDAAMTQKKKTSAFRIDKDGGRTYWFLADNRETCIEWINTINNVLVDDAADLLGAEVQRMSHVDPNLFDKANESTRNEEVAIPRTFELDCASQIMSGMLLKCDKNQKNWKGRFVFYTGDYLTYYKSEQEMYPAGVVRMEGFKATADDTITRKKQQPAFRITKDGERSYWFLADCAEVRKEWIDTINSGGKEEERALCSEDGTLIVDVVFTEWKQVLRTNRKGKLEINIREGSVTEVPNRAASRALEVLMVTRVGEQEVALHYTPPLKTTVVTARLAFKSTSDCLASYLWMKSLERGLTHEHISAMPVKARDAFHMQLLQDVSMRFESMMSAVDLQSAATQSDPVIAPAEQSNVSILCCTFNMGNARCDYSLEQFLPRGAHDIYAIGVQECEYKDSEGKGASGHWASQVEEHLGDEYVVVETQSMWSMRIVVLCRGELRERISNLVKGKQACGIAGVGGNKGAVAIAFDVDETSMVFINSHLAAHQEEISARNNDYVSIAQGLGGIRPRSDHSDVTDRFHHCFWFGDLNYRIDLDRDHCLSLIEKNAWAALRSADQLRREMKFERVFTGFEESEPDFPPTYRYNRHEDSYSEEKLRVPSFCDRVLSRSMPLCRVARSPLCVATGVQSSDHRPVFCTYDVEVRKAFCPTGRLGKMAIIVSQLVCADFLSSKSKAPTPVFAEFRAEFVTKWGRSAIVPKTLPLNAKGTGVSLDVEAALADPAFLASERLLITAHSAETGEFLGQAWVPLEDACLGCRQYGSGAERSFSVRLRHKGLYTGTMGGVLQCIYERLGAL